MGNLMDARRRIMMSSIPDYLILPSAYKKLPFVTANGDQAIRSPYLPVIGDEFHVRFKLDSTSSANGTLMSAGAGTYQLIMIDGFTKTGWYYRYFNSTTVEARAEYSLDTWYDVDIDANGSLRTNGKTFTSTNPTPLDGTATNLWICERRNATQQYSGSIAEFWIKNNGKYKMYLIPCMRKSDQKVGMYDSVSKTFFTSGRSDFIAGT